MNAVLDEELVYENRRRRKLTPAQRIAINLFRRRKINVIVIARAFKVSRTTVYYRALGHTAESYPNADEDFEDSVEANRLIEKLGVDRAWERYVTDDMVEAVNRENKIEADKRAARQAKRRAAA